MKRLLSMVVVLLLASAGAAMAQTGGVTGNVVDDQGASVEGARVSLWLDEACVAHVFTDAFGDFEFEEVPVGTYILKAGKAQVGKALVEDVVVEEGQVTDVGTVTLEGDGPHGPNNNKNKFQYQQQNGDEG